MRLALILALAVSGVSCSSEEPFGEPKFICWFYSVDPEGSHYPITISVDGKLIGTIGSTAGINPDVFSLKSENIQLLTTNQKVIRAYFGPGTFTFKLQKSGNGGIYSWRPVKFPDDNNINLIIE